MKYIAFLYKENVNDEEYNINIPDIEGAFSYGYNFEHAVEMSKELLEVSIDNPSSPPVAHTLDYFTPQKLEQLDIPQTAIPQVVEYVEDRKKRVTVNLHISALNIIDDYIKRKGFKNRSAFLEETALKVALS